MILVYSTIYTVSSMASKSFSSTALSIYDFLERFPNDQACQDALEQARWPHGFVCPRCEHHSARTFARNGRKMFECRGCRYQTHPGVGTIFTDTKLPLKIWFFALYLLTQSKTNVSALELTRHLGVCQRTAWRIKHKIMEAMSRQDAARQLRGFVEIDDAYLGGERNDGIRGRGASGKQPFIIAVSTDRAGRPHLAAADPVARFDKPEVERWARTRMHNNVRIFCDGLGGFHAFDDLGLSPVRMPSQPGRKAAQQPRMKWVNTVLGNIKRAIDGRYHSIRCQKYARRYLHEATWRFNRRDKMATIIFKLIDASAQCATVTERALRDIPTLSTETRR